MSEEAVEEDEEEDVAVGGAESEETSEGEDVSAEVVEEAVDVDDVAGQDSALAADALLKKLHGITPPEKIISDEINSVLHDNNFQAFHSNIICIGKDDCYSNKKSIELVLSSNFDKLIQFLNELKYDYIKTKNENFKFLTENINTN